MVMLIIFLLLLISIILGFNGMPYMFIFPSLFLVLVIVGIIDRKNNKVNKDNNYTKNIQENENTNLDDETLEEHVMFTEMTDHYK